MAPEITHYGFAVFSHALENLCREADLQLLISCTEDNAGQERVVVDNLVARQVDGLIVASSMLSDSDYVKLSEQLPLVLFDRYMSDAHLSLKVCPEVLTRDINLLKTWSLFFN